MRNVTNDERRRASLALRSVSDIGPGMTCRTGDQVLIDIAIAVGLSGACTLTDLTHRLAALMDPGAPDRIERYERPSGDAS